MEIEDSDTIKAFDADQIDKSAKRIRDPSIRLNETTPTGRSKGIHKE